jgi:hypothetical protein
VLAPRRETLASADRHHLELLAQLPIKTISPASKADDMVLSDQEMTVRYLQSPHLFQHALSLNPKIYQPVVTASVLDTGKRIACGESYALPLLGKKQIANGDFTAWSSTSNGDGDMYYTYPLVREDTVDQKQVIAIIKNNEDHNISSLLRDATIPNPPDYRVEVDLVFLKCNEPKFAIAHTEDWNSENQLVRVGDERAISFSPFLEFSPWATLQRIICPENRVTSGGHAAGEVHQ